MDDQPRILIVDDEPKFVRYVRLELLDAGFEVLVAATADAGIRLAEERRPHVVLLDVVLPGASGFDILPQLKAIPGVSVIALTGMVQQSIRPTAVELGADDFLLKPFRTDDLISRIRFLLRDEGPYLEDALVKIDGIEIDLIHAMVRRQGGDVALSKTEWALLRQLASHAGQPVLNQELLSRVWGPEYSDETEFLRLWISRLRAKLECDPGSPRILRDFHGVGYVLSDVENE